DSFGTESEYRRDGFSAGDRSASSDMGQDILSSGESGNRVSERLDDDEEIKITLWDRIKEYPVVIFKMIWAPLITLYHFGKAIWTGKVFPLKPQRTITDHGEVVG